jgi:cytochrome c553
MTYHYKMNCFFSMLSLLCCLGLSSVSSAAPAESGVCPAGHQHMGTDSNTASQPVDSGVKKLADAQCSSCHGTDGISISDNIPNLAGQNAHYMCGWLVGCRTQGDKCEGHEDLADKFTDHDISTLSEFYSHLPAVKR